MIIRGAWERVLRGRAENSRDQLKHSASHSREQLKRSAPRSRDQLKHSENLRDRFAFFASWRELSEGACAHAPIPP